MRFNILYGDYDYIILQQAAHPFPGKEALLRDALSIKKYIDQTKAVPVSYMTWAEKAKPENQRLMASAYIEYDFVMVPSIANGWIYYLTAEAEQPMKQIKMKGMAVKKQKYRRLWKRQEFAPAWIASHLCFFVTFTSRLLLIIILIVTFPIICSC